MASIILHVQSNILFHFAQQESDDDVQTLYRTHMVDTRPILLVPFEGGSSTREMGKTLANFHTSYFPHWSIGMSIYSPVQISADLLPNKIKSNN
jgi:hypothetical protein